MLRSAIFLLIIGVSISSLNAQGSNYQVTMIKSILQQFNEVAPGSVDYDSYSEDPGRFVPLYEAIDESIYEKALSDINPLFSLTDINGGYSEIDGKEYATNSANLVFNYLSLPGSQNLNAWFEVSTAKDQEGKNLLLGEKMINKYREIGIIEEGYDFPMPGEFSETIWFNRELNWDETINIEGSIHMELPEDYNSAVFLKNDTLDSKVVDGIEFQLLDIDQNIVTYRLKGDRRKIEGITPFLLDEDDKPYISSESVAIDAGMYDFSTKQAKALSDEEIAASVADFDYSNNMVDQVKKTKVNGNVDKLVLFKINGTKPMVQNFSISPTVTF